MAIYMTTQQKHTNQQPKGQAMSMEQDIKEVADRMRRVETRLTAYLVRHGEKVGGEGARWNAADECVVIASYDVPLSKCVNIIPADVTGNVYIRTEDHKYVATIHVGGEK